MLNLRLHSSPDTAGLVRAVLGGIATAFALRPDLLNDLKTIVGEACNDAVDHAYRGDTRAIAVRVDIQLEEIEVTVRDGRRLSAARTRRTTASSSRVSFALIAREQRLELMIGPLGVGTGERLQEIDPGGDHDLSRTPGQP